MTFSTRLGGGLAVASLFALTSCSRAVTYSAGPTSPTREHLTADTPKQTVGGATFVAPADWTVAVRGPATILEAPEGDSRLALVDVRAPTADSAVSRAPDPTATPSSVVPMWSASLRPSVTASCAVEEGRPAS